jgi:hypothetical protein
MIDLGRTRILAISPPIHQSTNPPIHQSTNPPIHQSTNPIPSQPSRPSREPPRFRAFRGPYFRLFLFASRACRAGLFPFSFLISLIRSAFLIN